MRAIVSTLPAENARTDAMIRRLFRPLSSILAALCVAALLPASMPAFAQAAGACPGCGTVLSVRRVQVTVNPLRSRRADRLSAAGESRVGVVDGPIVGRNAGELQPRRSEWEVLVMLDGGGTARIRQPYMPGYPAGSKVRVAAGRLIPR